MDIFLHVMYTMMYCMQCTKRYALLFTICDPFWCNRIYALPRHYTMGYTSPPLKQPIELLMDIFLHVIYAMKSNKLHASSNDRSSAETCIQMYIVPLKVISRFRLNCCHCYSWPSFHYQLCN